MTDVVHLRALKPQFDLKNTLHSKYAYKLAMAPHTHATLRGSHSGRDPGVFSTRRSSCPSMIHLSTESTVRCAVWCARFFSFRFSVVNALWLSYGMDFVYLQYRFDDAMVLANS